MDPLARSALSRAQAAISIALGDESAPTPMRQKAAAFVEAARRIAAAGPNANARDVLALHPDPTIRKAVAESLVGNIWTDEGAAAIAASYVATIADLSLLDQVAKFARVIPAGQRRVLLASGISADVAAEASPKVVRNLAVSLGTAEPTKCAALLVATKELLTAADPAGRALYEAELTSAITRAMNAAVLGALVDSNTVEAGATGDPLGDLRSGIAAAGASHGYVVAAPAGAVADLATRVENRGGMSVRGGTFVPGVEVVAVEGLDFMRVLPASRFALFLGGLELRASGEGDVNMADTPTAPSEVVSLWQTGCTGLIAERTFHIAAGASQVVVSGS